MLWSLTNSNSLSYIQGDLEHKMIIVIADSLRMCSSFESSQYASNNSGEVWIIISDSMSPLLTIGDVVAVENLAFYDLRIGDIIAFKEPVPAGEVADVIISRINEILTDPHRGTCFNLQWSRKGRTDSNSRWIF
jgi:hypothetical protein